MFVYTVGDVIVGILVILLIGFITYKFGRYHYLKRKYKCCPKCGQKTGNVHEVKYLFGEMESYEKFYCIRCNWEEKLKF